jgi:mannose-6-phosphate isomerase-like protein (cupin superfamily)
MRITLQESLNQLDAEKAHWFIKVMEHGTMSVELYRPIKTDPQTPHKQDELYIVISGSGEFLIDGKRVAFEKGDVLFVAAGIEHRFENFTNDFATWVIFYGPEGGER